MALIAFRAMAAARCAGLAGQRAAVTKDRRRPAPAPCVVGEDLGAGFGPLDLVELVSAVRVHFEGLPFVRSSLCHSHDERAHARWTLSGQRRDISCVVATLLHDGRNRRGHDTQITRL
jgi:hypothetical protein